MPRLARLTLPCAVAALASAGCSSPPPRLAATASLTCDQLEALTPGAGSPCASDSLRNITLEALTLVDARTREPIVTVDHPRTWFVPLHGHVDSLAVLVDKHGQDRAAAIAQLKQVVRAFLDRGWSCSDPALPAHLEDPHALDGLAHDDANRSGCRLEQQFPDASPWHCDSPPGDPRLHLRLELRCPPSDSASFWWELFLSQVDPS
ncbi:MAG: hypothetical protein U1F43_35275 [Myxococcota bacterium]